MPEASVPEDFEALLSYLQQSRGFDFAGYKRNTLVRRIERRMQTVGAEAFADYQDYLEVHQDEFALLFDAILINVTSFFRDPPAWDFLRTEVVPGIVKGKDDQQPIRIWSAGCSSGEEAYSLAIAMADAMGPDEFRDRVKIYATDIDEDALDQARAAVYTERALGDLDPKFRDRYFEPLGTNFAFSRELRRGVIFGRHDLIQDAPISHIDLLACRNTLMYFNAETQDRIMTRFHFALNEGGFLFLGKAEMLLTHADLFTPVDLKCRVFAKTALSPGGERPFLGTTANGRLRAEPPGATEAVRHAAFDTSPTAQLIIDASGVVVLVNEQARRRLGILDSDVGRSFQDLELSYRPAELRSAIRQAYTDRRRTELKEVEWSRAGERSWLDIEIVPLFHDDVVLGASIGFLDVTRHRQLQDEVEQANHELEAAYEELQSTNEELETTNEELQSTVEELETTNEELQSTNEELETMNEELQSSNEELQTMNDELRERTTELHDVNLYLESIVTSLRDAVVVVDAELRVRVWSRKAEDLWGLRWDEVAGHPLFDLDFGLPLDELRRPLRRTVAGESDGHDVLIDATNRRGRSISCRLSVMALRDGGAVRGAVLMMEDAT